MNEQQVADLVKALALLNGYLAAVAGGYEVGKAIALMLKGMLGGLPEKTREEALAAIATFESRLDAALDKNVVWRAEHQA